MKWKEKLRRLFGYIYFRRAAAVSTRCRKKKKKNDAISINCKRVKLLLLANEFLFIGPQFRVVL